MLSEALKRQGQLIENVEELEAEKKKYQREAERLKLQNDRNTATLREMQGSIEEQADAMAFSEKMLSLSREQTESLHAMRESLRDKEEVVAQKVGCVSHDHSFPMKMPTGGSCVKRPSIPDENAYATARGTAFSPRFPFV